MTGRSMFIQVGSMPVRLRTLAHWMGPRRMSYLACLKHGVQLGPMPVERAEAQGQKHLPCSECCREVAEAAAVLEC